MAANNIIVLPEAESDIDSIYVYIADILKNLKAADDFLDELEKKLTAVLSYPESCSFDSLEPEYRFMLIGNYKLFYRYINGDIVVFRVLYAMSNYTKAMK